MFYAVSMPLIIGHRGAPGYRPEHSRAAYELARTMGAGAVEPDVVVTTDGVLAIRHENEISGTTDVARRPEFADRWRTGTVDGRTVDGWFAEDFTADEITGLHCRERLPELRPGSAGHDGEQPVLLLRDLLGLFGAADGPFLVIEVKHAAHFAALDLDPVPLLDAELRGFGGPLPVIESFEPTVLARCAELGVPGRRVLLLEEEGSPADLVAEYGDAAPEYRAFLTAAGLDAIASGEGPAGTVDGISLPKAIVLERPAIVAEAHDRGLEVFIWTLRPENAFLAPEHRRGDDPAAFGDYVAEWRRLADAGADAVFADHPDLAREVFGG